MKTTRHGVFETNSSSTHSISIADGTYIPSQLRVEDGVCEIHTGEFGWEVETYHDAATKAAYCLTYIKEEGGDLDGTRAEMLRRVIMEATGAAEVRFVPAFTEVTKGWNDYYEWGYIDHQSGPREGDACGAAFESEDALRAFIFNPASLLHTDNDN